MEERTLVPLGGMVRPDVVAEAGTVVVVVIAVDADAEPPAPGLRLLKCVVSELGLVPFRGPGVIGDVAPIED
jgi:hypothetical protein